MGEKYEVKDGELNLVAREIVDISEIEGLSELTNLKALILRYNQITEIKGLENLNNLQELDLSENKIKEIKGLRWDVQAVHRTRNPSGGCGCCGTKPFLDGNDLIISGDH